MTIAIAVVNAGVIDEAWSRCGTRYGGGMETLSVAVKVEQAGGRQGQSQS
jgi:hypothetical protein